MESLPEIFFSLRDEWRNWLSENHNKSKGVWLIFYKKETGKPSLNYDQAVEEALCFGWIDGIIKNLNQEKYARKIMPRTNFYNWSPTNRKRVEKLIELGRMTEIGLSKIGDYLKTGTLVWPGFKKPEIIPFFTSEILMALRQNEVAFSNFSNMSASHQKRYVLWIMSAKQEETRQKRIKEAISLLEKNFKNLIK